ncbi:S8 family serine peptidase [Faecalicatena sp. AGMB00832]|uniref:S8 family serine peptidase n=1 Tax=Faecalicatena faecalis TaxID=2726362 RepID=A0ABS6CYY1_9FIRM|nr:S8 family peptidase [Faecalicatena faecalis]MBU3874484.1 S8 family serine peptidase [Faecalicatena faecalis]
MSQKVENLLNLALDATEEERVKSLELEVGFNPIDREWDLIVKYSGSLDAVRALASSVTELSNEYAVITIRESLIDTLALIPQIEFIEKPKSLFFQIANGKRVSCIGPVQQTPFSLRGNGVLTAVIDSGIDYANSDFRNADGTTRIRTLWDQTIQGNPPQGYHIGTEYTREQINEALRQTNIREREQIVPSRDTSGHGTGVAGIAAGNGLGSPGGQYAGVAPESELLVVKLGSPRQDGFPRTTELMQGVDYAIRKGLEYQMPVAVNISFGNTYGSHDGTSLLERFLDDISNYWKSVICVGSGNEGTSAGHTSGILEENVEEEVQLGVQMNEPTVNVQIWKDYVDQVDISIVSPSGVRVGPIQEILGPQRFVLGGTKILLYYGEPSPFSVKQEIFLDFLPRRSYIDSGIWKIVLTPRRIVTGNYQMWLPSQSALNVGTAFAFPVSTRTLTIPSTAPRVVTVGAYDALTFGYADFSGRGPAGAYEGITEAKPDLAAPGVRVTTTVPGGGYREFSGTSFATPFVTGSAALLMEWGIVRGNDPYLYGEKVKAYLRRGARELPGFTQWPNNQLGWGALCVRDSLPE